MAKRDSDNLAMADSDFRAQERARRAAAIGAKNPAATDWMRRDARELTWQERTRREWASDDRKRLDSMLVETGTVGEGEDDWRIDEFRGLLKREHTWRTKIYRWWLTVWDASAEDYLFDPAESDDFGFPKTRLDGTPWGSRDERRSLGYDRRSAELAGYYLGEPDEDWYADVDDEPEWGWAGRVAAERRERRKESGEDDMKKSSKRGLFGMRRRKRKTEDDLEPESSRARGRTGVATVDEDEEEALAEAAFSAMQREAPPAKRRARRSSRYDDDDLFDDDFDEDDEEYAPRRRSRRGASAGGRGGAGRLGSRTSYVEARLSALQQRVSERVDDLAEQEEELGERREDVIDELRSVKKEIEGEPLPDEAVPKEIRGPRRRASVLLNRSRELSQTRMRVWAALDEAERRLDEIKTARRALKSRGLAGLNTLVKRREISRSLRTFLEKIL